MRRFTLTAILLLMATLLPAKTYIVCAGIADYPGRANDLRVSANDALTIARIFDKNKDAEGLCYTNAEATLSNVTSAMRQTFARAGEHDVVIFFFSGHGLPGCFVCYDGFLRYSDIFEAMSQSRARSKVVIADACYSGKIRRGKERDNSYSDHNVMLFLSSRSNETSMELPGGTGFHNSLFTAYVERGLRGGADANRDRTVTARELYNYVHRGVTYVSGGRQHPVMWGKFDAGMAIIKW